MQSELAISEDFEKYDDKEELRRLVRAVRFSQKHYLYFACCNQVPKQNALIAETEKALGDEKIRVIKFKKPITDLLGELQKKRIGKRCEAVFVQGLEYSISSDATGAENALIHNLNISRDTFKKYLPCPLFLWLPEYAIVKITRHAPDFFSVRSGTFYFSNPPEKVAEQIFQSVSSSSLETSSLPLAEKLKQIETLEDLLAEHHGLHQEKQDKQSEMYLLSKLANLFGLISEYRKEIEYLKKSLRIARKINNQEVESDRLRDLGHVYSCLGKYQKAINYQEQSLLISRKIGYRKGEGRSLMSLAYVHVILEEYQKAIEYGEQSLMIAREVADQSGESGSLSNLGIAYSSLGNYQKAIEYGEQSLTITRETNNRHNEGNILTNLGIAYRISGEYRKAIKHYEQALVIALEIGDREIEGNSLNNLGTAYEFLGEKEKACSFWKEGLIIFEAIESPHANIARQLLEENCKDL